MTDAIADTSVFIATRAADRCERTCCQIGSLYR